jgi:transmembrane sensor
MNAASDDERLWQEALSLFLKLRESPDDRLAKDAALRWQQQSPAHRAAWTEAEHVWRLSGKLPEVGAGNSALDTDRFAGRRMLSRRRVIAGLGVAAATGVVAIAGPDILRRVTAHYATSTAEIRRFDLSDGSVATLGPDSAMRFSISETVRQAELISGMAYFDIARGPAPFAASCGALAVTTASSAFDLSYDATLRSVGADQGQITISVPRGTRRVELILDAGEWLSFDERDRTTASGQRDAAYRAAWRHNVIVAERDPINAVVAKVARWHRGTIMIAPGFGERRISGIFDLRDPVVALEAIVAPFDGKVHRLTPWFIVLATV